ncbi:hypothetical protein L6164_025207 [Bauhinia variegata]|uniref:Uncharacterized protein n=1 Tax=Bauhinia variegata TaxID=167791 RepID=A0ACB9LZW1_BAUVA|nr:hypothetical protein L6164_025207 [Bauhinia variegata]
MAFLKDKPVHLFSNSSVQEDDIFIKKIFLAHDPDGRWLDSETMLRVIGNIMFHVSATEEVPNFHFTSICKSNASEIELLGCPESVGCIIRKISCKILCECSSEGDLRSRMMGLFDLLGNYRWDAKVVLMVAAFAARYGEFWLLLKLSSSNALAASIFRLRQMPRNLSPLKKQLRALNLLVKAMVDVAKCIIKFESLPLPNVELSNEYSDSTVVAAWELSSLTCRLNGVCNILRGLVDARENEIERVLHEVHLDNQEVLQLLFPWKVSLPLKDCVTQAKLGVSELKNKIVLLLISNPELPLMDEEILLLSRQTCDHPLNEELKKSYVIAWVPIPASSDVWTDDEDASFNHFSGSLPWYSLRKPWLLSSAVVKWIKAEWNYNKEPIMVVMDSNGKVTNLNAINMLNIWGLGAYPFTASKEAELWQQEKLTMQLLIDHIDPFLADWVAQGKNICIYGGDDMGWIREFNGKIEEIKQSGLQLEILYVGKSGSSESVENVKTMTESILLYTRAKLFWLRLESMRRSKQGLGKTVSSDDILAEFSALMDDTDEGWAIIGKGSSADILRLQGKQVLELLNNYEEWRENVDGFGLVNALRYFLGPPFIAGPCDHSYTAPSTEVAEPIEEAVVCQHCKRIMNKLVVFQ